MGGNKKDLGGGCGGGSKEKPAVHGGKAQRSAAAASKWEVESATVRLEKRLGTLTKPTQSGAFKARHGIF